MSSARIPVVSRSVAVASVLVLTACNSDRLATAPDDGAAVLNAADAVAAVQAAPPEFVPGEVLVKFREGAAAASRGRALGRVGGQVAEDILTPSMRARGQRVGIQRVRVTGTVAEAIASLTADPDVEYAEPNWIYRHQQTVVSNDPLYTNGSLWGMYSDVTSPKNEFGIGAAVAWGNTGGTACNGVVVGIIDEGYMFSHEDLSANAGTNPGEIAGNAKDDDGNGLIDDVQGWDFNGNNNTVFDGTGDDHGTHVAGTIAGVGNNAVGVAGVCQSGIKLLGAKFLGNRGGTTANAIKSVEYFTGLKTRASNPVNIVATNNSWGGGGYSQGLKNAIDAAGAANILFVAAAGNSGTNNDATASYPSGYTSANIIAVASITSTGGLSSFSQYGATTVDIGAPGSDIQSTVPKSSKGVLVSGYASYSGTSMATPHVTGAVAYYAARNTSSNAAAIKKAILDAATATTSLNGKVVSNGRLNISGF